MFSEVKERNRTLLQKSLHEMSSNQLATVTSALKSVESRLHKDEDIAFINSLAANNDMETLEIICLTADQLNPEVPLRNALRGF